MNRMQKGFTLIELMIVVAIIGILAAIAIPQYQDYITRSKWQDNIAQVQSWKTAVAECLQNSGGSLDLCDTSGEVNTVTGATFPVPSTSGNASAFTYGGAGVGIQIDGKAAVNACRVHMIPAVSASSVTWVMTTDTAIGANCTKSKTGTQSQS